jgi:TPR repeat protein
MNWFARAAAKGNASAQWKIGLGYLKGIGMPQNDKRAAEWFKRAANQGHIGAQFALSEMYLRGCGVPVDYVRAYTWAAISLRTSNQGEQQLRNIEGLLTPSELQGANMRIGVWWGRHTNATLR